MLLVSAVELAAVAEVVLYMIAVADETAQDQSRDLGMHRLHLHLGIGRLQSWGNASRYMEDVTLDLKGVKKEICKGCLFGFHFDMFVIQIQN